jgi:hypothetical protein
MVMSERTCGYSLSADVSMHVNTVIRSAYSSEQQQLFLSVTLKMAPSQYISEGLDAQEVSQDLQRSKR